MSLCILLKELIVEDIKGFLIMDEMSAPKQDLLLTQLAWVGRIEADAGLKLDSYRPLTGN